MIRLPWTARSRPLDPAECPKRARDLRFQRPECREKLKQLGRVAVVGGGFAGLMAARRLVQHGVKVTLYEARKEVGGRVLSNPKFSEGRITEEGAELIGSFHTKWLELAREFGLAMISRMEPDLYERECLDVRLSLEKDRFLSMKEFWRLTKAMNERVLKPLADFAKIKIVDDPSRPWLQSNLQKYDDMSVAQAFEKLDDVLKELDNPNVSKVPRDGPLWNMLEFKLVNDEVAPLDEMNFLGLLCKVRAGQGQRCVEDDDIRPESSCISDGYWDELEIFRCADGCQTLAKKMREEIQTKKDANVFRDVAITRIELSSKVGVRLWYKDTRDNRFVDEKAPARPIPGFFSYVVLAIPPSVWSPPAMEITADDKDADPGNAKEIGQMQMNDAVKYFSDVKERFWIKERPDRSRHRGAAPYGGSFRIGQVWEGTDNQTRIGNQGIVLSVFAGPVSPSGGAPKREDFERELPRLYPGYNDNLIKRRGNPLLSDWPHVPFIKAGYWSPRPKDIWKVGEKLTMPYHDRLFFAGEHTQMDFFGYMEGALRSGERAAETLMLQACGLLEKPAPKPSGPVRVARAAPTRESAAFEREVAAPFKMRASGDASEGKSPFLGRDLFAGEAAAEWEPRVAALVAESPFVNALEELGGGFDLGQLQ
jgi:monoamine oxidase